MYTEPRYIRVSAKVSEAAHRWKTETGYSWGDLIEAGIKASSGSIHRIDKEVALVDIEKAALLTLERIKKYRRRKNAMESSAKDASHSQRPL